MARATQLTGTHPRQQSSSVNFNVSVGTVVPTSVHFAPLPASIIEIHPGWRGYDYFVYNEEVIVIEPHSYKIIEIIVVS